MDYTHDGLPCQPLTTHFVWIINTGNIISQIRISIMKLKKFRSFVRQHYTLYGPKKRKEIESRPEHIDKIVDSTTQALGTSSRYHNVLPHPYHPHVHEENENNEEI